MDKIIKMWMNILLFSFLMLVLSFVVSLNIGNNKGILILLSTLLVVSASIRYLFFYETPRFYHWGFISIIFDACVVFFINNIDKYKIAKIFYLVLIGDSILFYTILYGLILTAFSFGLYLFSIYGANSFPSFREFLPDALSSLAAIIFIVIVMGIVKYVVKQHAIINNTMEELRYAHMQLEENSVLLQQMAVVKERNRIVGEVHDTVGHTLTTVLIEIQAGKRILKKDVNKAVEKLDLAEAQVRNGLCDIMKSIKMINEENRIVDIELSIKKLIEETERHAGIKIRYNQENISEIPDNIQKAIHNALKEGLTNGIRHGRSTEFDFLIKEENKDLLFSLKDNGTGCDTFTPGFGIQTMTQRIEELGGAVDVETSSTTGFKLIIKIPLER